MAGETNSVLRVANAQVADTGSYTVEVWNEQGCVSSPSAAVSVGRPLVLSMTPDTVVSESSGVTLEIGYLCASPIEFHWYKNDQLIPSATDSILVIPSAQLNDTAEYYAVLSTAHGSVTSAPVVLTVRPEPVVDQMVWCRSRPGWAGAGLSPSKAACTGSWWKVSTRVRQPGRSRWRRAIFRWNCQAMVRVLRLHRRSCFERGGLA